MAKVTIIRGTRADQSANYIACMSILEHCGLGANVHDDTETMMKLTKGRCHPELGFVITFPNDNALTTDFFGLVRWIENQGLKPL